MGGCHTPTRHGHPPPEGGWHHCGHWRDGETCCACGQTKEPPMDGYHPHDHQEYVEGCFRCDLSRDEVGGGVDADELAAIRDAHRDDRESTHWGDCHLFHPRCAVWVLADEVERWRDGVRDLLRWREGDLPSYGYLRDNDKSREALANLAALLGEGNQ